MPGLTLAVLTNGPSQFWEPEKYVAGFSGNRNAWDVDIVRIAHYVS